MPLLPTKEAAKGVALAEPELIEKDVDLLLVGGGMGNCGVAYEACRWIQKAGGDLSILLLDKAAMERSGAIAQGLSAINTYLGENNADDYVRMVRTDLMGIVREDLIFDLGRHVDDSVHLFEEWGLPCWIKKDGKNLDGAQAKAAGLSLRNGDACVRSGRWQMMINGESYKCIVAEAAKLALGEDGYMERIFIVKMLLDANEPNRIAGAVGFSTRENKVYVFKCNAAVVACGGAVNVFRPRSTGEGMGRAWYPVWNAGSTYTMCAQVGAEMTMMENRFVPARFKDGYGPVGAWFLLFKAKATNYKGEDYCETNRAMLKPYEDRGYAKGHVIPTCLRNHMMLREMREGRGPIYMDTATALQNTFKELSPAEQKHLESEAWEDFLDMCVGQANLWACMNIKPEESGSEIMPTEPYLLGSHSGCCGIWTSGPDEEWVPEDYKVKADNGKVYNRMTTVNGLFTCADGVGASGHKFSSGSHAEGRIVGKQMVRWCVDHKDFKPTLKENIADLAKELYQPWYTYEAGKSVSTCPVVNPSYITPKNFMMRLVKCTDEYGGGCGTMYVTSGALLTTGFKLLGMLEEDSLKLAARDLHELMRCWEQFHRLWTVRLHLQHISFREESRYPGFYYRGDFMGLDDTNWKCFVNSKYDVEKGETVIFKKAYHQIIPV
ncbi:dissimilatory adenylylsulfate reductase alpha subunit precursor [Maridesulfovibrio ferrireducens]|uniref:Dissimilatory adenylylsulfate reductase alpha subunit n=1 Tax=Maridesulfovibrio ferrireducens TaxID=246191 RepID=A0A1G9BKA2_9BACT|nr:adenylyl-sulfate reductase subunit alpha [Maridesulfovibrio ferrireducens]SDK39305.1 dissimilatory adenylylsulfate reductase alpha subunit precursor [Maridesulfovibrio ferrireducens]